MYTILLNGQTLYSPLLCDQGYAVVNPVLIQELNSADALTFICPASNPRINSLLPLKATIEVYDDSSRIFYGRISGISKDFYNQRQVICEGALAFFNDVILRPYTFNGTVSDYISNMISQYNGFVNADRRMTASTDIVDNIQRANINYPTVLEEMREKLVGSSLEGFLLIDYALGYAQNMPKFFYNSASGSQDNSQTIQFGVNLLDLSVGKDAEETYSIIIPLGAIDDSIPDPSNYPAGWNDAQGKRLTIYDYYGSDSISSQQAETDYGKVERVVIWDDVTQASNLYSKADATLNTVGRYVTQSVTINAVDMKLLGQSQTPLKLGNYYKLVSYPHQIVNKDGTNYYPLVRQELHLDNPSQSVYTFGKTQKTLTGGLV